MKFPLPSRSQQVLIIYHSIVFSGWVKTLDVVEYWVRNAGIKYLRLDGTLNVDDRERVLSQFRSDPTIPVLLMTIGTGAVG